MGRAPGAWSSGRSERLGRLRRELGRLGEGPTVGPHQAPESWPLVESFLEPSDATALGRAMLPGRARSVAGQVVEELQRRRQALVPSLVNHDRTAAVGSDVGLTVLVEGLGAGGGLLDAELGGVRGLGAFAVRRHRGAARQGGLEDESQGARRPFRGRKWLRRRSFCLIEGWGHWKSSCRGWRRWGDRT